MIDGKQDLGRILETMLYYDRARLLVSTQTFTGLWDLLGPDDLCVLFGYPSVTVTLRPQMLGEELNRVISRDPPSRRNQIVGA